jgi:hypothetical protein
MQEDRWHVASARFRHFFRAPFDAEGNVSAGGNNLTIGHDPTA